MYLMADILAWLTPDNLTSLAYLAGAFMIGGMGLVGMFWLADSMERWLP